MKLLFSMIALTLSTYLFGQYEYSSAPNTFQRRIGVFTNQTTDKKIRIKEERWAVVKFKEDSIPAVVGIYAILEKDLILNLTKPIIVDEQIELKPDGYRQVPVNEIESMVYFKKGDRFATAVGFMMALAGTEIAVFSVLGPLIDDKPVDDYLNTKTASTLGGGLLAMFLGNQLIKLSGPKIFNPSECDFEMKAYE